MSAPSVTLPVPAIRFGRFRPVLAKQVRTMLARLMEWDAIWRERRRLATLDGSRLDDLGLTRRDVLHEAARPVWDV